MKLSVYIHSVSYHFCITEYSGNPLPACFTFQTVIRFSKTLVHPTSAKASVSL